MTHLTCRRVAGSVVLMLALCVAAGCSDSANDTAVAEFTVGPIDESSVESSVEAAPETADPSAAATTLVVPTAAPTGNDATPTPLATPTPTNAADSDPASDATGETHATDETPEADAHDLGASVVVAVIERRDHDPDAFTQGLEFHDGRLFESRGLYGESALTEIDPTTGEVLRTVDLPDDVFGEGLTIVGDRVIVITWQEQRALVFDIDTFDQIDEFAYEGEGWGLCFDGDRLVMSNGSNVLTFRDPDTFEVIDTVDVILDGQPVEALNELECSAGRVWSNVWQEDRIVVIDPASGEVVSTIDASGLLSRNEANNADVLNGIAHDSATDSWLITGKLWPAMFEVEFVPS